MKDVARRAFLLDFYGPLLTGKQRELYDWYYQQDLSLGEISEVAKVSRNAVYDIICRTDEKLERYERALGLIAAGARQAAERAALAGSFDAWLAEQDGALSPEAKASLAALIARLRDES